MSWNCDIRTFEPIKEEDIDKIVETLPPELSSPIGNSKQLWGWSCGTDISIENNSIDVHGAGFSRHLAEPMTNYLKRALKKLGYTRIRNTRIR
jgi:hypothetical protein